MGDKRKTLVDEIDGLEGWGDVHIVVGEGYDVNEVAAQVAARLGPPVKIYATPHQRTIEIKFD